MRPAAWLFFLAFVPLVALAADTPSAKYTGGAGTCIIETVTIEKGKLITKTDTTSSAVEVCQKANDNKGCTEALEKKGECKCGTVKFSGVSGKACPPISKCDARYKEKLGDCLQGVGVAVGDVIDLTDEEAERTAVEGLNLASSADREKLTQILQGMDVTGVNTKIVHDNPNAAKELALKILDSDQEGAEAAARRLGLNGDLSNVKYLQSVEGDELPEDADLADRIYAPDTTFGSPASDSLMDRAKQAIASIESGGRYYLVGKCTNGDCPYGKYQVMGKNIPSWTYEALGRAMSPQDFLSCAECQERVFEHRFGGYAEKYGYEGAARAWFAGERGMWSNSRDILGTSVSSYAYKFNCVFNGECAPRLASDPYAPTGYGRGSPFANVNPFASASPAGYAGSAAAGGGAGAGYLAQQNPVQQFQPVSPQLPPGTGGGLAVPSVQQPVAAIIVQPKEVTRGNPLVVSWSTIAMSVVEPCRVYLRVGTTNSLFAQGNDGSRTFVTSATSTPGTWNFTLQCISASGTSLEREASLLVK